MSPTNFGERYFAIRDQLAALMAGVASLAHDTGVDVAELLPLDSLRGGLCEPMVFAVCGEVNAGKSTFLNALCGASVCKTNVLPETASVTHHCYGSQARDRRVSPMLMVSESPLDFLRDFHLLDTPGTNFHEREHLAVMGELLPRADLIFCIFPVDNPWGATVWNFLESLPAEAHDRMVFVIQQADLREPKDLKIICGHMRDLSFKRLGMVPQMFVVSARLAFDAKRQSPVNLAVWRASGFSELEEHIARTACQSPARWALLSGWRHQTAAALRAIEARMEERASGLNRDARFLDEIEREIDVMRERFTRQLPHHLAEVSETFEAEAAEVTRALSRRLGVAASLLRLFRRDKPAAAIAQMFADRLQAAVETVATEDAAAIIDTCRTHWHDLGPRVETMLGIRFGGNATMEDSMELARRAFIRRIGRAAGEGVTHLNVRRQLDNDLRLRHLSLTSFTIATLGLTTIGGICGALGLAWLPFVFCGLGALFLAGGVLAALATRRRITREYRRALQDACGGFADSLHGEYEESLGLIFRDYAQCLGVVRDHLVRENQAIEPRQRRWQEMFLHLKAVEQEI